MHLAVLLCYGLLTVIMTWPLAIHFNSAIPGDGFDGWQNYWNLWWMRVALVDRVQNPYFTDLLYFPTGVELYFHTLNPFNGLLTLPIQLTVSLFAAYNTVVMFSWVLGGYGMFLLSLRVWLPEARRAKLGLRYGAAFVAGAIFTFAPIHMAHLLGHMQVMSLQWIPFYCLYLWRGLFTRKPTQGLLRDGLLAGGFLVLTGLCDWYFVLYLFLLTGLALIWRAVLDFSQTGHRTRTGRFWQPVCMLLVCTGLFVAVLGPILFPMVQRALSYSYMVRPTQDLFVLSASVSDLLLPNRLHTLFRPESFDWIGNQIAPVSERTIGIGYVALALAVIGAWRRFARSTFWLSSVLFFGMLALGPVWHLGNITWQNLPAQLDLDGYWTPFAFFNRVIPFMRISRSVSRFALMVQMSVAVLAAGGLLALGRRQLGSWQHNGMLIGGALIFVLAEYWVAPYPISPPDTPAYYATLAEETDGALLNLPMNYDRPGYLLYQTVHGRPLSVAYISRDDPRTLVERVPILQHFRHLGPDILVVDVEHVGQTVLTDLAVEKVVLDRYKMPGGSERTYTTELAQRIFKHSEPEYEDDRLTVYGVVPPDKPAAYVMLGPINWGPLQRNQDLSSRHVGSQPAEIYFRHGSQSAQLRIRYRTVGDAVAAANDGASGSSLLMLPASAQAQDGFVKLADVSEQIIDGVSTQIVTLQASEGGGLEVIELELVDELRAE